MNIQKMIESLPEGPYVEDCHGIYMGEKIQEIAMEFGWSGFRKCDHKEYFEQTEDAINFLNEIFSERECEWGYNQGSFGLWRF